MKNLSFLLVALVSAAAFARETAADRVQRELIDAVERISWAKAELIRLEPKTDVAQAKLKSAERRLAAAVAKASVADLTRTNALPDRAGVDSLAPVRHIPAPSRAAVVADDPNVVRRDAYRRQAAELEAKCYALRDQIRANLRAAEAMTLRAEMIEGVRKVAPSVRERLCELRAYEEDEPKIVTGPGPCVKREIMLEEGLRYRVTAQVKAEDVRGTVIILSLQAPFADGSAFETAADVGAGTFDWRTVAFDFEAPAGVGLSSLRYGLDGGSGEVSFREVTVYSVSRTLE